MRLSRRVFLGLVVAGAVAFSPCGYCDDQAESEIIGGLPYVDSFDRTTVTIDVVVRDRDANPVTGLSRDAFQLLQDGSEVEVSHFAAYTQSSFGLTAPDSVEAVAVEAESPHAEAIGEEAQPAYIIVYIDNQNLRRFDRNRVLRALRGFFAKPLGGPVRIMVVAYQYSLEVLQPFTEDPNDVVGALQDLRIAEVSGDERYEEYQRVMREIRRVEKDRHRRAVGVGQSAHDVYTNMHAYAREETLRLEGTLGAIRDTIAAMTGIAGRKYLLYVSNGLPLVPGKSLLHEYAQFDRMTGQIDTATQYSKSKDYDALASAASSQEITIHAIDASGAFSQAGEIGEADSPGSAATKVIARDNRLAPLRLLAERTGGLAVVNTEDFSAAMERIRSDLQVYYSIGYEIESSGSDTVHHVEVKLRDTSEYETRYRRTVIEKSMESRMQDEVTAGLFFHVGDNPLGIEVTRGEQVKATETRWLQPLDMQLPVPSLAMTREGSDLVGKIVLFVAMRNLAKTSTDLQRQHHEFRLPADEYEARMGDPFSVNLRLLLESGHHNIVIGVLDESTRQTSFLKMEMSCPDEG